MANCERPSNSHFHIFHFCVNVHLGPEAALECCTHPPHPLPFHTCVKVRFGPEAALELHKQLYRTKLASLVENGRLTASDQTDLKRIRRILCISDDAAKKVARETSGRVLEAVVGEVLMAGAKPIADMEMQRVDKVIADFAIDSEVAMEVLSQVRGAGEMGICR